MSTERGNQHAAVLWSTGEPASGPIREVACVALDAASRAEIAAFLRDHANPSMHVTLLSPVAFAPDVVATTLQVAGIEASVDVSSLSDAPSMQRWLDEWKRDRPIDLLVFSQVPAAFLLSALRSAPVLLLPPSPVVRPFGQRTIDVPDLLDDGGPVRARVDQVAAVGDLAPMPDQAVAFVSGGRVVATVTTHGRREAELPAGLGAGSLGVYRVGETAPAEPLAAVEQRVAVIGPGDRPLVLVDSELTEAALRALADIATPSAIDILAVRLRPTRSCRSNPERLRALGLPPRVLDARLVLDEGPALDVSEMLDSGASGARGVEAAEGRVPGHGHRPQGPGGAAGGGFCRVDRRSARARLERLFLAPPARDPSPSGSTGGNRIVIELDNATARGWLLDDHRRGARRRCTSRSTWPWTTTLAARWKRRWRRPVRAA